MRRFTFAAVGILELAIAGALLYLGLTLPSPRRVGEGFDRVEDATHRASRQVATVRRQVVEVRRPEMQNLADRLRGQTEAVSRTVRSQRVNFETIGHLRDSLRDVSRGVDGAADTLDAERVGRVGRGLAVTAGYIDDKLIPATGRAADQLDVITTALTKDAATLAKLLKEAPPDLKAARDIHDSLGRFDEGLDKMMKLTEMKRLDAIKDGFAGLESSLDTTAGEVERLAGYKYPAIKVRGLKIEVEEKPFWPNGERVADGLRKAGEGVRAAQSELDGVAREMPGVRTSLEESRKVVARTRAAIGKTLEQQDKLEPLLRDIPNRAAALAEALPKLAADLGKLMRETRQLREVSVALRLAQAGLDVAAARWPELQKSMRETARLLRTSSDQLDRLAEHRVEYEASVKQSTELADTFAQMVPLIADQIGAQLTEQERGLADLEVSLDEVGGVMPEFKRDTVDVLAACRVLIFLIAATVALHGVFVLGENVRQRPNIPN